MSRTCTGMLMMMDDELFSGVFEKFGVIFHD
jgi:hypothetical protein